MDDDDADMTFRVLRLATVALAALALASPAVGHGAIRDLTIDRGVVQSVGPGEIVLRALDGGVAAFVVSPTANVTINGFRGTLREIRPGFVAAVAHDGSAPVTFIRAFGRQQVETERGAVTSVDRHAITLRTQSGPTVTIPLDRKTRFLLKGLPLRPTLALRLLSRPGTFVEIRRAPDAPAKAVNIFKRRGA